MNHWRQLNPSLRGTLILVLVGVLVVGAAWWYDGRDRVNLGPVDTTTEVFAGQYSSVRFKVPGGFVDVTVEAGDRTADTDHSSGSEDAKELRAPRGGQLVQVSWSGWLDNWLWGEPEPEPVQTVAPRLAIDVAGERHDIDDQVELTPAETARYADDEKETVVLAVPTKDRHLVVELEFAGKKQSVDVATGRRTVGAFAPLYRPGPERIPAAEVSARSSSDSNGLSWIASWRPMVARVPYVDGLGWAKPGREWLMLSNASFIVYAIQTGDAGGDTHDYEVRYSEDARGSLTVAGGRAGRPPGRGIGPSGYGGAAAYTPGEPVYDVARGEALTLKATMTAPLQPAEYDSSAPERKEPFVATQTATVPAVLEPGADR